MSPPPRVLLSFPTRLGTTGIGTTAWNQAAGLARRGIDVSVACGSLERELPGVARGAGDDARRRAADPVPGRRLRPRARLSRPAHGPAASSASPAAGTSCTSGRAAPSARSPRPAGSASRPCSSARTRTRRSRSRRSPPSARGSASRSTPRARTPPTPPAWPARSASTRPPTRCCARPTSWPARTPSAASRPSGSCATATATTRSASRPAASAATARSRRPSWAASSRARACTWRSRPGATPGSATTRGLRVCGSIDAGYDAVLAPLLADPSVEHLGHHPDPGSVMREADVLVLPSVEEGSALVTYEARGSGCVLVVSDHSGAPCRHEHDALVHTAGDVETLRGHLAGLAGRSRAARAPAGGEPGRDRRADVGRRGGRAAGRLRGGPGGPGRLIRTRRRGPRRPSPRP